MQKNGIFSFCSGSFSKYNVKVRRDCTITFDTHIIYKKSIKYKKMIDYGYDIQSTAKELEEYYLSL